MGRTARSKQSWVEQHLGHVNRLSSRQYSMASYLDSLRGRRVSYEVLRTLNQTTIGSFITRGYLEERDAGGGEKALFWTEAGSDALATFITEKFDRIPTNRFSSALSLALYDSSRKD